MDYENPPTGTLTMIKGRKAVYLYYASYAGGSGPLWAIEGIDAQITTQNNCSYTKGVCEKVFSDRIIFRGENGISEEIPISAIQRYDQFYMPCELRFNFDNKDIAVVSNESS